jgi:hypothetical protein
MELIWITVSIILFFIFTFVVAVYWGYQAAYEYKYQLTENDFCAAMPPAFIGIFAVSALWPIALPLIVMSAILFLFVYTIKSISFKIFKRG